MYKRQGEYNLLFLTRKMFEVPVSNIFLSEHNPISDLELSIFDKCFKISLYLRFLYSGFSLFNLTSFKLKSILV